MNNQLKIFSNIKPFKKSITISADKSISIRCLLLSSIALGKSKISNLLESEDVLNSIRALKKNWNKMFEKKNYFEINGLGINGFQIKKNNN